MTKLDLTPDEQALLRKCLNGVSPQMDIRAARVFVSLVNKIDEAFPEPQQGEGA